MKTIKYISGMLLYIVLIAGSIQGQSLRNKILFSRHNSPDDSIFAINTDGTGLQFITIGWGPKLSPDGHYVLFLKGGNPDISMDNLWIRNCLTQHDTVLFYNSFDHFSNFGWNPSGTQIVFDYSCSQSKINPDGSNLIMNFLQGSDCYDDNPDMRSSDSMIVFHNKNQGLFTAGYNGTGRSHIPNTQYNDLTPYWSPNGKWISFGRGLGNPDYQPRNFYKMMPDGSGLTQLSYFDSTALLTYGGEWSSDSSNLIIAGTVDSINAIWALATNGSGNHHILYANQSSNPIDFVSNGDVVSFEGIDPLNSSEDLFFTLYPNPVKDRFTILFQLKESARIRVSLNDISGKVMKEVLDKQVSPGNQSYTVSVEGLSPGNYLLGVRSAGFTSIKKITILPYR